MKTDQEFWDECAAAALTGFTVGRMVGPEDYEGVAMDAAQLADALVKERIKRVGGVR